MNTIIYTLVMTHITILCVTLFLHRSQAHKAVTFHPVVTHFMRFWLWLTTGMVTRQWVAIHRRHHQKSDQIGDPHSPQVYGIWRVLFGGAFLYHQASKDTAMVEQLGIGTPNDWVENTLYAKHSRLGIMIMLFIDCALFGVAGLLVWGIQMIWIPFWAAGVVNGLAHWWGYRNADTKDTSRNLVPWGIVIGGEELHNNHHANGTSARLSSKWFEFDEGWLVIRLLSALGLAQVRT
ncbi:OLE1 Fatty-acid desaturase [uncultured Caudovirales phage]|uniref:OLE1 Fatty-acid desaturase n=1 Tax=uncultured Caudovirales phage TaxID=2100421 RepID=A0A6J5L8Z8_9CAUD|nr:OLE1 Fatty-acid desaturase [uncultured Caudovirales phage]